MPLTYPPENPTQIDRRVRVIEGHGRSSEVLISSLRERQCYVLLGEPGSGKSTVLMQEAYATAGVCMTVRDFLAAPPTLPGTAVCLDALDEYRSEGRSTDRIYTLAAAMVSSKIARWRLSCRAEDWRLAADLSALKLLAGTESITVVELLPLNAAESELLLEHFGCEAPEVFLAHAEQMGAHGLVENPFSLSLLFESTHGGDTWPTTRFELFNASLEPLARERDRLRQRLPRHSREEIIKATGRLNLFLLVTGAQAIWLSTLAPPNQDRGRFLDVEETGLAHSLVADTLDTALFRGNGESFIPMHRTIAEFSAAQYLFQVLSGGGGEAALPLPRLLAVITGADCAPPTELRGLYGWFVAHLSRNGRSHDVQALVAADPITILHYGDPAVYSQVEKRTLLSLLPAHTPHHGWPEGISLGGLASEELIADFSEILLQDDPEKDVVLTVIEILERGAPLPSMATAYSQVILSQNKPIWLRTRALALCVGLGGDPVADRRHYYNQLKQESDLCDRVMLQVNLAEQMMDALTTEEIKSLLHDFEMLPPSNVVGQLITFGRALTANVPVDLFDVPANTWREEHGDQIRTDAVDRLLDDALASLVEHSGVATGAQVWQWAQNLRQHPYGPFGPETVAAISRRYGDDNKWRASMLEAACSAATDQWRRIQYDHRALAGGIDEPLMREVRDQLIDSPENRSLLAAFSYGVRGFEWPELFWSCHKLVQQYGDADLEYEFNTCPLGKVSRSLNITGRPASDDKANWLQKMNSMCSDFEAGRAIAELNWGAGLYINGSSDGPDEPRLAEETSPQVANAMIAGFRSLAAGFAHKPDGLQRHLAGSPYMITVYAGVLAKLSEGEDPPILDVSLALAVFLTGAGDVYNYRNRLRLRNWSEREMSKKLSATTRYLEEYWSLHMAMGVTSLPGLPFEASDASTAAALGEALVTIMRANVDMSPHGLAVALKSLALCLPTEDLVELVDAALPKVSEANSRMVWRLAQMCLNPVKYAAAMLQDYQDNDLLEFLNVGKVTAFCERLLINDSKAACYYFAFVVCALGPKSAPPGNTHSGDNRMSVGSIAVRSAIRKLAANPTAESGVALKAFANDPALALWQAEMLTALVTQASVHRNERFSHTTPSQLSNLLKNGPPLNSVDLFAVLVTEIDRIAQELRIDELGPWTQFWNYEGERLVRPRVENLCRDYILGRLRDRLEPYRITAAMPEAQHAGSTRADMLVVSGANARIPVEVKRHMHTDVWIAAETQLQHYSQHMQADGMGVYLVLWFGLDQGKLPARPGKRMKPASPQQLRDCLVEDLPEAMRKKTQIYVLDVTPVRRT